MVSLIVAFDKNRLIGRNNELPWHLPADLKHFKEITMGHHMVMGRNTFESIGKPLPGRTSVVITSNPLWIYPGCISAPDLQLALEACEGEKEVFIIGGARVFRDAIALADKLYVTEIDHQFEGDTWFPEIDRNIWERVESIPHKRDDRNNWDYTFVMYRKKESGNF
ncbi:MAG TPA: dihydrofolate reductase [Bacteroidia bacterium]|nr:dihydrofolate reductase [Bacteroidia bacterium]